MKKVRVLLLSSADKMGLEQFNFHINKKMNHRKVSITSSVASIIHLGKASQRLALSNEYFQRLQHVRRISANQTVEKSPLEATIFPNEYFKQRLRGVFADTPFCNVGPLPQFLVLYGAQTAILELQHHPASIYAVPLQGSQLGPSNVHRDPRSAQAILIHWLTENYLPFLESFVKERTSSGASTSQSSVSAVGCNLVFHEMCCILQYTLWIVAMSLLTASGAAQPVCQSLLGNRLLYRDLKEASSIINDTVRRTHMNCRMWNCQEVCREVDQKCQEALKEVIAMPPHDDEASRRMSGHLPIALVVQQYLSRAMDHMHHRAGYSCQRSLDATTNGCDEDDSTLFHIHQQLSTIGRSSSRKSI